MSQATESLFAENHEHFFNSIGQTAPFGDVRCMAVLPPKADVHPRSCYVAFVPKPAVSSCSTCPVCGRQSYSITSSAVASRVGGTARPSILAVEALMTNSNLVDCTTGKSAGFAP